MQFDCTVNITEHIIGKVGSGELAVELCEYTGGEHVTGDFFEGGIKIRPYISTEHLAINGTWSNSCGARSFGSAC